MGHNLQLSILFIAIVLVTFSYSILLLGQLINPVKWLLHFGIAFLACHVFFIDDMQSNMIDNMLTGTTAISILIHHEIRDRKWISIALVAAMFGLYIKSSIGVMCLSLLVSYCVIYWFLYHDRKKLLTILGSYAVLYFIFWFFIYHNFQGSIDYLWSTFQFVKGYSAMAVQAENHWKLLGTALALFFLIPAFYRDTRIRLLYGLFLLTLFSAWKHSYSREEEIHLTVFYNCLILFFFIFIVYVNYVRIVQLALIVTVLICVHRNTELTGNYFLDDRISLNSFNNFNEAFFNYKQFADEALQASADSVQRKKLPDDALKIIGNKSIDFFPTELGYVAANKVNWKPRPVIQSYSAYTEWLDKQDAQYFASENSAQFILWEFNSDRWGGNNFGEIDNRYVLNNEPDAIYQLLNHYKAVYKNSTFILFKKVTAENLEPARTVKTESATWNQWIKVPQVEDGIVRAKMTCLGTFLQSLKSALFKDAEFYMDCKLSNGNVIQYHIIPENAQRGLWINPLFIKDIGKLNIPFSFVDEIRFTCSSSSLMQPSINVSWDVIDVKPVENIPLENKTDSIYNGRFKNACRLFLADEPSARRQVLHSLNDFEAQQENWSYNTASITGDTFLNGKKAEQMNAQETYSSTFSIPIDKYLNDSTSLIIDASAWFKLSDNPKGCLVIQLSDDNGTFLWKTWELVNYVNDQSDWEQIFAEEKIQNEHRKNVKLGVYILNDKSRLWIDDFEVKLYTSPKERGK